MVEHHSAVLVQIFEPTQFQSNIPLVFVSECLLFHPWRKDGPEMSFVQNLDQLKGPGPNASHNYKYLSGVYIN